MASSIAEYYENIEFPFCPSCNKSDVKKVLAGQPTPALLAYSKTPRTKVILDFDSVLPKGYYCETCKSYFDDL